MKRVQTMGRRAATLVAAVGFVFAAAVSFAGSRVRVDALPAAAWEASEWISVGAEVSAGWWRDHVVDYRGKKLAFRSPAGTIESAWRYEGDEWIWEFSVPDGATASVTLPGESDVRTYGPGRHRVARKAV